MSKDIKCPYCDHEFYINHDSESSYNQSELHEIQCPRCEKNFVYSVYIRFDYEAFKADCLNDGNHNYQLTDTHPREASMMRCSMCDDERELTPEEREKFGIGTLEDYFKSFKYKIHYE